MAAEFQLEILTPEKTFYAGEAEAVTVSAVYGDPRDQVDVGDKEYEEALFRDDVAIEAESAELTVLAHHHPMVAALTPGEIRIKTGGAWKSAYIGEGFLEVGYDNVVQIFSHLCEWPDAIDAVLAAMEEEKEQERLRNAESLSEHRRSEIELQRMLAMLRRKRDNLNN